MVRLFIYAALACVLCKMAAGRWPWERAGWNLGRGAGHTAAERRARALLGVSGRASRIEIIEAHKRLVSLVHPDRGGTSDQVHEANAARDLLLARLTAPLE